MRLGTASVVCIAAVFSATLAEAATFSGHYKLKGFADSGPVPLKFNDRSGDFDLDLSAGQSKTLELFDLVLKPRWDPAKVDLKAIIATFRLSGPGEKGKSVAPVAKGTLFGTIENGSLQWGNPLKLSFGNGTAGVLSVALTDETFKLGGFQGKAAGKKSSMSVDATFTYGEIAVAPLPAALPMFASAVGLAGVALWRRRSRLNLKQAGS